jgi:RNA polymerase subunit RPABC4/transcription elongation factor Spt4
VQAQCPSCRRAMSAGARFCPSCGTRLNEVPGPQLS